MALRAVILIVPLAAFFAVAFGMSAGLNSAGIVVLYSALGQAGLLLILLSGLPRPLGLGPR